MRKARGEIAGHARLRADGRSVACYNLFDRKTWQGFNVYPVGPRHLTRLLLPFALGVSLGCHGNGPTAPPPLCQVTTPSVISFTSVPPVGSSAAVMGNVSFTTTPCSADNYRVALFILVPPFSPTTYICKPTQTQPLTTIGNDGSWSAQYVSGGLDSEATQFRVPGDARLHLALLHPHSPVGQRHLGPRRGQGQSLRRRCWVARAMVFVGRMTRPCSACSAGPLDAAPRQPGTVTPPDGSAFTQAAAVLLPR